MITRDNYEEFFLLYTDNELSASERHEVERFVADHPDLREEWEALLQCRLSPDAHLSFPDRESLLKPEIEGSAYTGTLLSYIDGELNKEGTLKIEAILHEQPLVANELAVLRQIIFHPDPDIVFPEKDRLYRTERERRIIPLPWIRAGIAAAIAGAIALILLLPATPAAAGACGCYPFAGNNK
jgi:anti-sigma factor RsiW